MAAYIHYGSDFFYPSRALPARNSDSIPKPADGTGFWGSREDGTYEDGTLIYGWKEWCRDSKTNPELLKRSFRFRLSDGARLLVLQEPSDLLPLPKTAPWELKDTSASLNLSDGEFPSLDQIFEQYRRNPCYLDYEKMMEEGVDAIELRNSHLFGRFLTGWDCDCVVVLNPDVIVPMMENSEHALIHPVKH